MFWHALYRRALPFAPVLLMGDHFLADEELIERCARVSSIAELDDEIESHRMRPLSRGWLRKRLGIRVSTQRLRRLARQYLPATKEAGAGQGG